MNAAVLVIKNLTRNPVRSLLTMGAVALPMALFVLTTAVKDVFEQAFSKSAKELRLASHNRVTLLNPLPERTRGLIEQLDPEREILLAACRMTFLGAKPENAPPFEFPSLATDHDTWPEVFSEYDLDAEALREWNTLKNACTVGIATAENYGWKRGQEIELRTGVPPFLRLRFKIVFITTKGPNPSIMFCRRDYVEDAVRAVQPDLNGRVNMIWLKCKRPEGMDEFARRIDAATANTPDETKTQDESAFVAGFIKALGDLPTKVQIISAVVVLAIVMVVANTMSLAFRERTRELAALKAMGFPAGWLMRLVMAESITLALLGGLLGIVPTYLSTQIWPITKMGFGPMKRFVIPESSALTGLLATVLVGVLAGLMPSIQAVRIKVVDALRKVA